MVITVTINDEGARLKLAIAQGRLGQMQQALLVNIGAEMERMMKLQITSGPNKAVDTGRLRSNLQFQLLGSGRSSVVIAGVDSSVKYGKRIALGFTGTDSLGRNYDQRARPFHEDAWRFVRQRLDSMAAQVIEEHTGDLR